MRVHTQINEPENLALDSVWLPCLQTCTVDHPPAVKQTVLLTHVEAINHYQHSLNDLLEEKIHCVGARTYDHLKAKGFAHVQWYTSAEDIRVIQKNLAPLTWLRGDSINRNFGAIAGVTTIQTYSSQLHIPNCNRVVTMKPTELWVYSDRVLQHLQTLQYDWSHTVLKHTRSCTVNEAQWHHTEQFDPSIQYIN